MTQNKIINDLVEEFRTLLDSQSIGDEPFQKAYEKLHYQPALTNWLRQALTTYGNARELQGVEKVEKGVPEKESVTITCGPCSQEESLLVEGHNTFRQIILDHIAKIKSELK